MFKIKLNKKNFPIAICLIAYLFAWTNAASANILCIGSDGHIAIEATYENPCDLAPNKSNFDSFISNQSHSLTEDEHLSLTNASDSCTDTSIPFDSLNKSFSADDDNHFIAFAINQPDTYRLELFELKSKAPAYSKNIENQNLNFLKTVILTI